MNVNDSFSHELGGDTLNEYIYSNVKKKVKEDKFPAKNSRDLIGDGVVDEDMGEAIEPIDPVRFVAKVNVTDTSSPTALFNNPSNLAAIEIDGVVYEGEDISNRYTFDSTGIHMVKYTLKEEITTINFQCFSSITALVSITIPENITAINGGAFGSCSNLTSIIIPNSVTSIIEGAFNGCSSLTSITIPGSVTSIGGSAFSGCTNLSNVVVSDYEGGNTTITNGAFSGCTGLVSLTLGNSITTITGGAFQGCTSLTKVNIPNSVTDLSNGAFAGCIRLTRLTIPSSVVHLNNIGGHFKFNNIRFRTINPNADFTRDIVNKVILDKTGTTLVWGFEDTAAIPNSVTSIESSAFSSCTALTSITIPNSVTTIGDYAFYGCSALTSITIPDSVTSIDSFAFLGCTSLTSIASLATKAPSISSATFRNIGTGGTLTVPTGSTGYDAWMEQLPSGWTLVEQ